MPRGAQAEQSLLNTQAGNLYNTAQGLGGQAAALYSGMAANPGFSQQQIGAQTNAAVSPIAGQTASAQGTLARRAAATRNSAGLVAGQDQAARTGAGQMSQAAYNVQANAGKEALQQTDEAAKGLSGLYGNTLGSVAGLYSIGEKAMEARPSYAQTLQNIKGTAGTISGALGGGFG